MIDCKVFSSEKVDSKKAIQEILQAMKKTGATPTACLVLAGYEHDSQVILDAIYQQYPQIKLIGTTSSGEFLNGQFFENSVICGFFLTDPSVSIDVVCAKDLKPETTRQQVSDVLTGAMGKSKAPIKLVLAVTSSVKVSGSAVVTAANTVIKECPQAKDAILWGAGSIASFSAIDKVREFFNQEALEASAVFMLFSGDLKVRTNCHKGWEPMGEKSIITEAHGNVIHTIGGRPALEFFTNYLGKDGIQAYVFTSYPMALYWNENDYHIRAVIAVDKEKLICAGDVPTGASVRLTSTTKEKVFKGLKDSAKQFKKECDFKPAFGLVASCIGRRFFLGTDCEEEPREVSGVFPELKLFGFFAGGEVSPVEGAEGSFFHNNTHTILLVG